ncbi:MAG: hypothetical protein QUS07_09550 [Methanothrix sp.]|nr:hypothetical protein [Methanothrix sp.]
MNDVRFPIICYFRAALVSHIFLTIDRGMAGMKTACKFRILAAAVP